MQKQLRQDVFREIASSIKWLEEDDTKSPREKMISAVFAAFSTLDGSRPEVPAFIIAPVIPPGDTRPTMNENAAIECNIGGEDLHHGWHDYMTQQGTV